MPGAMGSPRGHRPSESLWLEEAGFGPSRQHEVEVEPGKLTLRAV